MSVISYASALNSSYTYSACVSLFLASRLFSRRLIVVPSSATPSVQSRSFRDFLQRWITHRRCARLPLRLILQAELFSPPQTAIAGGVVGGLLGLALLILLSYFFYRRRMFSRLPPPPYVGDYSGKNGQGGTGGEVEGFYTAGPGMPVLTYAQMVQQSYRGEGQGVVAPYQAARAVRSFFSPPSLLLSSTQLRRQSLFELPPVCPFPFPRLTSLLLSDRCS